jgi:hypothetical protein
MGDIIFIIIQIIFKRGGKFTDETVACGCKNLCSLLPPDGMELQSNVFRIFFP